MKRLRVNCFVSASKTIDLAQMTAALFLAAECVNTEFERWWHEAMGVVETVLDKGTKNIFEKKHVFLVHEHIDELKERVRHLKGSESWAPSDGCVPLNADLKHSEDLLRSNTRFVSKFCHYSSNSCGSILEHALRCKAAKTAMRYLSQDDLNQFLCYSHNLAKNNPRYVPEEGLDRVFVEAAQLVDHIQLRLLLDSF